jgi:hypothetical protein
MPIRQAASRAARKGSFATLSSLRRWPALLRAGARCQGLSQYVSILRAVTYQNISVAQCLLGSVGSTARHMQSGPGVCTRA